MSGLVPGNVHVLGDTGQFYTIVTVNDVVNKDNNDEDTNDPANNSDEGDDANDILVCGKCKQQFSKVDDFIEHKTKHCRIKKTKLSSSQLTGSSKEVFHI